MLVASVSSRKVKDARLLLMKIWYRTSRVQRVEEAHNDMTDWFWLQHMFVGTRCETHTLQVSALSVFVHMAEKKGVFNWWFGVPKCFLQRLLFVGRTIVTTTIAWWLNCIYRSNTTWFILGGGVHRLWGGRGAHVNTVYFCICLCKY